MKTLKSFKKLNKAIAFVLVTVLFVTGGFVEFSKKDVRADITVADRVNNPRTSSGVSTWDCVYFGHYEQTKNKKTGGTSTCDYFKEPIKWRVLEKANGKLFLMADQSLESIQYNESEKHFPGTETIDNTWEHSDLRDWLNSSFYNDAFDRSEKADIIETNVTADKCIYSASVEQGADTEDNVYVLSQEEANTAKYGFAHTTSTSSTQTNTRSSVNTNYTHRRHYNVTRNVGPAATNEINDEVNGTGFDMGLIHSQDYNGYYDCGIWWLRTVSQTPGAMTRIDHDGAIHKTKPSYERNACVRPVINVDQNSELLRYAGTVSSDCSETNYCGDTAQINFNLKNCTLTIFGSGEMYDFSEYEAPWHKYYDEISTVVVDDEVTSISANAFEDCYNVQYVYLNENVTQISADAFTNVDPPNEDLLFSVEDGSPAHTLCEQMSLNYTLVRSKISLAIEIDEIFTNASEAGTCSFTFRNPMAGQSYEVLLDGVLVQVIHDDIHDSQDYIDGLVTDISSGTHLINVRSLVVGSEGTRRITAGKILRVNGDSPYSNPEWISYDDHISQWQTVYFGRYPQTEDENGEYYAEDVDKHYKVEKLKWRVLNVEGDIMTLITDKAIENRPLSTDPKSHLWETSNLRSWLNDDSSNISDPDPGFMVRAFNQDEKAAIQSVKLDGKNITDKVYILSKEELKTKAWGFYAENNLPDKTRRANVTDYAGRRQGMAKNGNVYVDVRVEPYKGGPPFDVNDPNHQKACIWWTRHASGTSETADRVNFGGNLDEQKKCWHDNACVRPVIQVDMKSAAIEDAGTVDSNEQTTDPAKTCKITIDGKVVDTVKEGSTYTLPVDNTKRARSISGNYGYMDEENPDAIYRKGTSFAINRDRSFDTIGTCTAESVTTSLKTTPNKGRGVGFVSEATVFKPKDESYNPIFSKAFEYGVLVTTYGDYVDYYNQELTLDTQEIPGHTIHRVPFKESDFISDQPGRYRVGITNLKQSNYAREFIAVPYIILSYKADGGYEYVYPNNPLKVQSASNLAWAFINSSAFPGYSKPKQQWIRDYTEIK